MHCYGSGVLLLAKLLLYSVHLYQCRGDEYMVLAARLALMPRFATFVNIVSTVFEMTML
jgi:hypothetical protein